MWNQAHDAYLESRVLSAGPVALVRILYQTAESAVRDARRHLEAGDVLARSNAISRASAVLLELTGSLDFARGGEIAGRLGQLYAYMLRRLTEANFRQQDAPLAEVLSLLSTLHEAWAGIEAHAAPPQPDRTGERWKPAGYPVGQGAGEPARAWSL